MGTNFAQRGANIFGNASNFSDASICARRRRLKRHDFKYASLCRHMGAGETLMNKVLHHDASEFFITRGAQIEFTIEPLRVLFVFHRRQLTVRDLCQTA